MINTMNTNDFSERLASEMYEFRFAVVKRNCRERGYRLSDTQIRSLLSEQPDSLQRILEAAGRLSSMRRGGVLGFLSRLLGGIKSFFKLKN